MKIIKLEAENIKRLRAVEISPDGSLIIIGGKNAQGKSSVLDSIEYALAGASSIPSKPIRKGEKKARIVVEIDSLIVTRTFTDTGSKLVISDKEGFTKTSPQALLDSLTGKLSFDPLAFINMDPDKQLRIIKELAGVDLSELDNEKKKIYDNRALINALIKTIKGQIEGTPKYEDVPKEEVSYSQLMMEQEKKIINNQTNDMEREKVISFRTEMERSLKYLDELRERIKKLRALWDEAVKVDKEINEKYNLQLELVDSLIDEDTTSINEKISQAKEINSKIQSNLKLDELLSQLKLREKDSDKITKRLEEIEDEKVKLISSSKLPIQDLTFDNSGIFYNGVPFEQASSAEQLRISVAMGFAMNPKLKILLIRDGSLLDENNLKMIADMAEIEGGQLWLERVGEGKECQVIIEDGRIKE
jgi:DNA repair exonuclease SbcCD ATPase subunit